MKHMRMTEMKNIIKERKWMSPPPPPPPPPPPLPKYYWRRPVVATTWSATKEEIAEYWRRKKIEEENHLLAALKAAARNRARNLSVCICNLLEEDYRRFEESLKEDDDEIKKSHVEKDENSNNTKLQDDGTNKEIRVGIKDWWTKSKYAYLNQPALESMDKPKKQKTSSTYIPNFLFYKPPDQQLPPTSFRIF